MIIMEKIERVDFQNRVLMRANQVLVAPLAR